VDSSVIRVARTVDEADWRRLWGEWQVHMKGAVPERATADAWAAAMDEGSGLYILIAYEDERQAVGFATVSKTMFAWTGGPVLFLQDLFVSETARGQGTGEALLKAIYDHADAIGASQVLWMVDESDERLQGFYARYGIRTPYLRYMRKAWPW
jgi:GNAT superfamily N-acetyltransferase